MSSKFEGLILSLTDERRDSEKGLAQIIKKTLGGPKNGELKSSISTKCTFLLIILKYSLKGQSINNADKKVTRVNNVVYGRPQIVLQNFQKSNWRLEKFEVQNNYNKHQIITGKLFGAFLFCFQNRPYMTVHCQSFVPSGFPSLDRPPWT